MEIFLVDNGLGEDYFAEEDKIIEKLYGFSISDEMWVIEKIYNGETYAQFEKNYGGVKNVCLQNSWAGTIRSSCENYKETVGGSNIKGCQYPHRNKPNNCVLRYNYDKKVCEPAAAYCKAFGLDKVITTPPNTEYTIYFDDKKKEKVYVDGSGLKDCKSPAGQEVLEAIFGTTLARLGKKIFCRTGDECCQNADCEDKFGDSKPVCAGKKCISKYRHNEPIIGACNALEEPDNIWNKPNVESPECGKNLFCKFPDSKCKWKNKVKNEGETCDKHENCKDGLECTKGTCGPLHWPRAVGEKCVLGTDCKDHDIFVGKGTNCCKGVCRNKTQDLTTSYYCPHEVINPLIKVDKGHICGADDACKSGACCGFVCKTCCADKHCSSGQYCKDNKCISKKKKGERCEASNQCADEYECSNGTCGPLHWPRRKNEKCVLGTDCKGHKFAVTGTLACCKGKCKTLLKDNQNVGYCPSKCSGKSTKPGITPTGTCHLSDGPKKLTSKQIRDIRGPFSNGYLCLEDDQCKSGWCHNWRCKAAYEHGEPKGGVCGSNTECKGDMICDTYCRYPDNTAEIGSKCINVKECKNYNTLTGKGTSCCKGKCTQKGQDWTGGYYCPDTIQFKGGDLPIGHECNKCADCADSECFTGEGTQCCKGKCTKKIKNFEGTYWCPNHVKCKYGKKGFFGTCKKDSDCCSNRCDNYKAAHTKNVSDNCVGYCHPDGDSCRGAAINKTVCTSRCPLKKGDVYSRDWMGTWRCGWQYCWEDGVACGLPNDNCVARKTVTTGYHKVASNKFNNQYCKNGWIHGTEDVSEQIGRCSMFNK